MSAQSTRKGPPRQLEWSQPSAAAAHSTTADVLEVVLSQGSSCRSPRVKKPSSGGVRWTAEEVGVGEDAAPLLAHERGADEVRWLFRRQAEEHVYDGVVDQLRRRPCAWRRHAWNLAFRWQGLVHT
jgi:hypothetical protein